jgi:hypothetical protein
MISKNLLILGDSTSMSVGVEKKAWPFLIANTEIWSGNAEIVNCSIPGFTSADAAAYFFKRWAHRLDDVGNVIIYLGNCDSASSEVHKGKCSIYSRTRQSISAFLGGTKSKTKLKNRLLHYEWNNGYIQELELPESPSNFRFNLEEIIKKCLSKSVRVILFRPKANLYFPPGVGKGNFIFYRYIGIHDKISHLINIPDERFVRAMEFHEARKFKEAINLYKDILLSGSSSFMGNEYLLVVLNNYAVACAESGNAKEALSIFQLALKERGARKEIILFNIAQIESNGKKAGEYMFRLKDSYEFDSSLYRIRQPYIDEIDRVLIKYPGLKVVDMGELLEDELYLDHCHPLPKGQEKIASIISSFLCADNGKGQVTNICNDLLNPEVALGNFDDFHTYFGTYSTLSEDEVSAECASVANALGSESELSSAMDVSKISHVFQYCMRHPVFSSPQSVLKLSPLFPSDVGRFPEYFIARKMVPYLRLFEKNKDLILRFDSSLQILRSSEQIKSILPGMAVNKIELIDPDIGSEYSPLHLSLIIKSTKELLLANLLQGSQIYTRIKSTIFWYVRESLRFGAHSRNTMLYDRIALEFIAEGLAVASLLDEKLGLKRTEEILKLISVLQDAVRIHENFCSKFSWQSDFRDEVSYTKLLINLAKQLSDFIGD